MTVSFFSNGEQWTHSFYYLFNKYPCFLTDLTQTQTVSMTTQLFICSLNIIVLFMGCDEKGLCCIDVWLLGNKNKKANIIARGLLAGPPVQFLLSIFEFLRGSVMDTGRASRVQSSSSLTYKTQHLLKHTLSLKITVQRSPAKVQSARCRFKSARWNNESGIGN